MDLPALFNEAYADACAALSKGFVAVPPKETICVLYNQRLGRSWGCASVYRSGIYRTMIRLSVDLCRHTSPNAILNTMIHEIVHCCGIWGHRREFKYAAALINHMFPGKYNVSRCTSAQEKMTDEQMDAAYNYIVECPQCHHKWGFKRFSRCVQHPETSWCPTCSTPHNRIHLIRTK